MLVKDYKYTPPAAASDDKPDENGITLSMLDFDFERDVEPQVGCSLNGLDRYLYFILNTRLGDEDLMERGTQPDGETPARRRG